MEIRQQLRSIDKRLFLARKAIGNLSPDCVNQLIESIGELRDCIEMLALESRRNHEAERQTEERLAALEESFSRHQGV